jgi:hypothetical protein
MSVFGSSQNLAEDFSPRTAARVRQDSLKSLNANKPLVKNVETVRYTSLKSFPPQADLPKAEKAV